MSLDSKIRNEAEFEAQHVADLRQEYLDLDIFERVRKDNSYRRKTEILRDFLGSAPQKVLDIGCNTGGEAAFMQSLGHEVIAGDVNEVALEIARERVSGMESQPTFVMLDAHNLPYDDNTFDAIVCWEVLHHLADLDSALAEIRRVMRPGATGLAYEPYRYNPYRRFSEVLHTVRTHGRGIEKSFSEYGLKKHLTSAGFVNVDIERASYGLTDWKASRYSPVKRLGGTIYYGLQERFPKALAPMVVTFGVAPS